MQSRLMSMIEAIANVLVGFWVSVLAQMLVLPLFDLQVSFGQSIGMGLIFTVVSLVRSYLLRRAFNAIHAMK